jgi:hypothetical protein
MKELWYFPAERSGARLMFFDGGANGDESHSGMPGRFHRAASRAGRPRPAKHGLVLLNGGRQRDEKPGGGVDTEHAGGGPEGGGPGPGGAA